MYPWAFLKSSNEFPFVPQTELIRKRLHKDILHHSVIMLNFCPDFQSAHSKLRKAYGEFIFLIDRSSSMCRNNINHVKVCDCMSLFYGRAPKQISGEPTTSGSQHFLFQTSLNTFTLETSLMTQSKRNNKSLLSSSTDLGSSIGVVLWFMSSMYLTQVQFPVAPDSWCIPVNTQPIRCSWQSKLS